MSLLNRGFNDDVIIYLEEAVWDVDGNIRTQPSAQGTPAKARIQPVSQSGTSARLNESDNEGFESQQTYFLRLPNSFPYTIGAQAEVRWNGEKWGVFGEVLRYNNSPKTAHVVYTIKRT